ncbi:hypothetical protein [Burkholderia ubonensis]|uniref:Flagella basal body P-ring formation protein FlgA C-terminal domain-containing protein n=1 Tax=Burkholderia ubonensis TaxID=101571 RepID=A0A107ENG5_9BURK|nr:hypothetical protein [Burkholderia ubonensis]KWD78393.1 hypothetical protein WL71_24640 [Burkholderia ubonensis]KWD87599.1 hypothetical protein WL70_09465 [Burkholderia ubonensis]KWD89742.1 hypothetical protein WL72_32890 [Burkholderia ubonensis]KWD96362.1 hypothetical protein WL73_23200 [Burkholderia ubonensis]
MTHHPLRQRTRILDGQALRRNLLRIGIVASGIAVAAPSVGAALDFRSVATVDAPTLKLSDVADLTPLPEPLRQRAADLIVLALAPEATRVRVDARRLADAARRGMPMLAPWLADVQAANIAIYRGHGSDAVEPAPHACAEVLMNLPAATAPSADQLRPAPCLGSGARQAWRYDPDSRVARAARDMTAGEIVLLPAASRLATIRRGKHVSQIVRVGAVTIVQSGTALTDAGPDRTAAVLTGNAGTQEWRSPIDDQGF